MAGGGEARDRGGGGEEQHHEASSSGVQRAIALSLAPSPTCSFRSQIRTMQGKSFQYV
jgi:hypothetical protein